MNTKIALVPALLVNVAHCQVVSSIYPWSGATGSTSLEAIHLAMLPTGDLTLFSAGVSWFVNSHAEQNFEFPSVNQSFQDRSPELLLVRKPADGWSSFPATLPTESGALAWGATGNAFWEAGNLVLSGAAYDSNLFCSSHIVLPSRDGKIVFFGGNDQRESQTGQTGSPPTIHQGPNHVYMFTPGTQTAMQSWSRLSSMKKGRWYPSSAILPGGEIMTIGGTGGWRNAPNGDWGENNKYAHVTGTEVTSIWSGGNYTSYVETIQQSGINGIINPAPNAFQYGNPYFYHYPFMVTIPGTGDEAVTGRMFFPGPDTDTYSMSLLDHSVPFLRSYGSIYTGIGVIYPSITTLADDERGWTQVIVGGGSAGEVAATNHTARMFFGPHPLGYSKGNTSTAFTAEAQKWYVSNSSLGGWADPYMGGDEMAPMKVARKNFQLVPLPNMTVLALNGNSFGETGYVSPFNLTENISRRPQRCPEIYDPIMNTWTLFGANSNGTEADPSSSASFKVDRAYHSTAALLPDGRVLSAGGDPIQGVNHAANQQRFELFSPPYKSIPDPPQWVNNSISGGTYGYNGAVLLGGPNPVMTLSGTKTFASAVLVTLPSSTHGYNFGQRMVKLRPMPSTGAITGFRTPKNPVVAPPGWYMLFVTDSAGAVSNAKIIRLTEPYSRRPFDLLTIDTGDSDMSNDITPSAGLGKALNSLIHGDGYERTGSSPQRAGRLRLTPSNGVIEIHLRTVLPEDVFGKYIRFKLESRASRTGIAGPHVGFYEYFPDYDRGTVVYTPPDALILPDPGTSDRLDQRELFWSDLDLTYPENLPFEPGYVYPGEWVVHLKWTGLQSGDWIEIDQAQLGGHQADPE